jgi:putative membrane protein
MMGYGGFGLGWMVVIGVFVSLVIIGLVLLGIGLLRSPSASGSREPDALEVLRLRFARGEITEEEYQTRRRHLEETSKRGENMR